MNKPFYDIPDNRLVALLKQGDITAYEAIFNRYYNLFLAFARGFVKDWHMAEDIAQEVFMKLWTYRDRVDEQASLYNLLFTMTKNRIYDHFRCKYNLAALHRPLREEFAVQEENDAPEAGLDAEQLRLAILRSVEQMPYKRRAVFVMSREENLSRQEISERLGLSVRTVDKHLELALRTIRLHLKDLYCLLLLLFIK